jgi:hypothetical protein
MIFFSAGTWTLLCRTKKGVPFPARLFHQLMKHILLIQGK